MLKIRIPARTLEKGPSGNVGRPCGDPGREIRLLPGAAQAGVQQKEGGVERSAEELDGCPGQPGTLEKRPSTPLRQFPLHEARR